MHDKNLRNELKWKMPEIEKAVNPWALDIFEKKQILVNNFTDWTPLKNGLETRAKHIKIAVKSDRW